MNFLKRLWNEEDGQGMVEYGLIIALIAIVVIVALRALGVGIGDIFDRATDGLEEAGPVEGEGG